MASDVLKRCRLAPTPHRFPWFPCESESAAPPGRRRLAVVAPKSKGSQMSETLVHPEQPTILRPGGSCPECGAPLAHEGGCVVCRTCGHSACGEAVPMEGTNMFARLAARVIPSS